MWRCSHCGRLRKDKADADKCCICSVCGLPIDVPKAGGAWRSEHAVCHTLLVAGRMATLLADAQLIEGYDGPVLYENADGDEQLFLNVDELGLAFDDGVLDYSDVDTPRERPEFVFCSQPHEGHLRGVEDILAGMDHPDPDSVQGWNELDAAIKAFKTANGGCLIYVYDYSSRVALPPEGCEGKWRVYCELADGSKKGWLTTGVWVDGETAGTHFDTQNEAAADAVVSREWPENPIEAFRVHFEKVFVRRSKHE